VDRKVEGERQLVHAVEDEELAVSQTQAARLVQDRMPGQEFQCVRMMPFADLAQMPVAREHLGTARRRLVVLDVILCPDRGGDHDVLDVSTTAAADAHQRHNVLVSLPDDSGNRQRPTIHAF
jgi:hypothetical protein